MPTKTELIKETRVYDWYVVVAIIMFLLMRVSVVVLFNVTATETGADIEAVRVAYEANPIFNAMWQFEMTNYVLQYIIIPALMWTIYFIFKRKVLENKASIDMLQFYVMFTFFLVLHNLINDAAALIGRLI